VPFRDRRANRPAPVNDLALHQILMDQLELTALNQFARDPVVSLGIDELHVLAGTAQDVRNVDDTGRLFVLSQQRSPVLLAQSQFS
jgi:hypothetical protein